MVNSALLGLIDYTFVETEHNRHEKPVINQIFDSCELFFTIAFTLEMCIKSMALGVFADKNCYLKDTWNILDATVVSSSLAALFPNV